MLKQQIIVGFIFAATLYGLWKCYQEKRKWLIRHAQNQALLAAPLKFKHQLPDAEA